jgi:hypothetical protein
MKKNMPPCSFSTMGRIIQSWPQTTAQQHFWNQHYIGPIKKNEGIIKQLFGSLSDEQFACFVFLFNFQLITKKLLPPFTQTSVHLLGQFNFELKSITAIQVAEMLDSLLTSNPAPAFREYRMYIEANMLECLTFFHRVAHNRNARTILEVMAETYFQNWSTELVVREHEESVPT